MFLQTFNISEKKKKKTDSDTSEMLKKEEFSHFPGRVSHTKKFMQGRSNRENVDLNFRKSPFLSRHAFYLVEY